MENQAIYDSFLLNLFSRILIFTIFNKCVQYSSGKQNAEVLPSI